MLSKELEPIIEQYATAMNRCNIEQGIIQRNKAVIRDFLDTKEEQIKKTLTAIKN